MKNKAFLCFLTFLVLVSIVHISTAEQIKEIFTPPNPILADVAHRKIRIVSATTHKGDVFIYLSNSELYRWKPGKTPEFYVTVTFPQTDVVADNAKKLERAAFIHLFSAGDDLMVINLKNGQAGKVEDKGVSWYPECFDLSALRSEDTQMAVISAFQHNKSTYIISRSAASGSLQYSLSALNSNEPSLRMVDIPSALSLCFDGSRLLLLDRDVDGHLSLKGLNLQSKEVEIINIQFPEIPRDKPIGGFCADASTTQICFFSMGQIYMSKGMKPFEAVSSLPFSSLPPWSLAWIVTGETYAVLSDGIYMRNLVPVRNGGRKLNVAGASSFGQPFAFRNKYPDVELKWQPLLVSAQDAYTQIMSKDSAMDIFNIQVSQGYLKLIEKGFVTSLNDSASIREDILSMYPEIQRIIVNDEGEPIAWPTELFIDKPQISTNLWKLVYSDRPLPKTFAELLDAMVLWENGLASDWPDIDFLMNFDHANFAQYLVDAYIQSREVRGELVDFSSPILLELLHSLEQVRDLREKRGENIAFISPDTFEPKPYIFDPGMYSPPFSDEQKTLYESREEFVYGVNPKVTTNIAMRISEEDRPYYRGRMMVWIVNPYSANVDLAIDFIQMTVGMSNAPELYYALHPNANEPYPDTRFDERLQDAKERRSALQRAIENAEGAELSNLQDQLSFFDKWLANLDNEKWRISSSSIDSYREIAPRIHFFENSSLLYAREYSVDNSYSILYKRYAQRQLTLEQLLDRLDATINLIVREQ